MSDRMDSRAPLTSRPEGASARILDVLATLGRRWPTWLALALVALNLGEGGSDDEVRILSLFLLFLPFEYLVMAAVGRRRASWIVAVVGTATMFVLLTMGVAVPVFVTAALIILVWGAVRGRLNRPDTFRVQALGMVGFGALALAGLAVDPALGRYLVAAGWFLHGIWDLVYFRADKVVARSYAEWCGVVDVLIAAQLIFRL
ncbi:MAG: hypothetical protein ACRDZO_05060 [Egibacteraceae bacterium]